MLIAERYDPQLFASKMQFVLDNVSEVQNIGDAGRNLSLKNFDYKSYGEKIINFLAEVNLHCNHKHDVFEKTV